MSDHTPVLDMTPQELADEIVEALRAGRLEGWDRGFGASITGHMRRREWHPSPRQVAALRAIVAKLRETRLPWDRDLELIDEGDQP